ncbi:phosphopantothenate--cysteine ligase [Microplitis demolitor]|uniref:phosphopantothenate--cysteine ligase n=1 Tax=Microplitis demolitor TaxID=69319 RepID=UPI0004CCA2CB|nr:phosphopantothenate--cysteine ligase [Microplitis demolitor]
MGSNWEDFYANLPAPRDLDNSIELLKNFTERQGPSAKGIVLVTSGGTTVPLEHNTVRFVDNFSAGTRGSVSAEYFLERGYAVIFMFRLKTLEPYSRHFTGQKFLDMLETNEINGKDVVTILPEHSERIAEVLKKYKQALEQEKLLEITFTTVAEYLWLLRAACQALAPLGRRAILYLAAAVSDFYIPPNEMSVHKIPSSGPPNISLQLVPKILKPLVSLWVPRAFVVSFKLETDENLLISKARDALNKYNHNLVIANMLHTRKNKVVMVTKEKSYEITLSDEQIEKGEEIEKYIINDLLIIYTRFLEAH